MARDADPTGPLAALSTAARHRPGALLLAGAEAVPQHNLIRETQRMKIDILTSGEPAATGRSERITLNWQGATANQVLETFERERIRARIARCFGPIAGDEPLVLFEDETDRPREEAADRVRLREMLAYLRRRERHARNQRAANIQIGDHPGAEYWQGVERQAMFTAQELCEHFPFLEESA